MWIKSNWRPSRVHVSRRNWADPVGSHVCGERERTYITLSPALSRTSRRKKISSIAPSPSSASSSFYSPLSFSYPSLFPSPFESTSWGNRDHSFRERARSAPWSELCFSCHQDRWRIKAESREARAEIDLLVKLRVMVDFAEADAENVLLRERRRLQHPSGGIVAIFDRGDSLDTLWVMSRLIVRNIVKEEMHSKEWRNYLKVLDELAWMTTQSTHVNLFSSALHQKELQESDLSTNTL